MRGLSLRDSFRRPAAFLWKFIFGKPNDFGKIKNSLLLGSLKIF